MNILQINHRKAAQYELTSPISNMEQHISILFNMKQHIPLSLICEPSSRI